MKNYHLKINTTLIQRVYGQYLNKSSYKAMNVHDRINLKHFLKLNFHNIFYI